MTYTVMLSSRGTPLNFRPSSNEFSSIEEAQIFLIWIYQNMPMLTMVEVLHILGISRDKYVRVVQGLIYGQAQVGGCQTEVITPEIKGRRVLI